MRHAAILLAPIMATTACAAMTPARHGGADEVRLGETWRAGDLRVTPVRILEDSRCPAKVVCIWAGQVRIVARVDRRQASDSRELTLGKPLPLAGGTLELVAVRPPEKTKAAIPPGDYRFVFRFDAAK